MNSLRMTDAEAIEELIDLRTYLDRRVDELTHRRMTKDRRAVFTAQFRKEQDALNHAITAIKENKLLWQALRDATIGANKVAHEVALRHHDRSKENDHENA